MCGRERIQIFVLQRIQLSLVKILIECIPVLRLVLKAGRDRDVTLSEREIAPDLYSTETEGMTIILFSLEGRNANSITVRTQKCRRYVGT